MSEYYVQLLYGICFTLGSAMAVVATIGTHFRFKPFNCVYCMTVWMGLLAAMIFSPTTYYIEGLGFWAACHVVAYVVYNKMS